MKIESGELYVNKTMKYLLPVLKYYGNDLSDNINQLFKLGFGIKDATFADKHMNNHIFILVDMGVESLKSQSILEWLRKQPYFEIDYPFNDIFSTTQHMIVLKIPEYHKSAYDNFLISKFSKMYHKDDIEKYFKKGTNKHKILTKDSEALKRYVDEINKSFDTHYTYSEWIKDDDEIERPIVMKEEIFNLK